ncbi:MAG: hypothetical protein II848_06065 [Candidatus Methanomethylophilus sp.]|nr:hypothetical protein [Methanomethylophilus sp.]
MDKRDYGLIILAVAVCAVVLVGEFATYGNIYRYDSSADASGNFSVYDSGSHCYTAVLSDNGSFPAPTRFYVYYDEGYGSVVHDAKVEVGAKALDQKYYLSQLLNNLKYYSVTDVTYVNAAELASKMSEAGTGVGLIMISGAIPRTVYDSSLLTTWISTGGSLYWAGEAIGKYIGESDGTVSEAPSTYLESLLGAGVALHADTGDTRALNDVTANSYRRDLSLKNNDVRYAVNIASAGADSLAVGYEKDGCASTVLVKNGSGMVCVMGGNYSNNQRMDMANIIASGICYCSAELDCKTGNVARGTVTGTFSNWPATGNVAAFLYLGGDFSVYGKLFTMTL